MEDEENYDSPKKLIIQQLFKNIWRKKKKRLDPAININWCGLIRVKRL